MTGSKKKLDCFPQKRLFLEKDSYLTISRQAELLGISRSSVYYTPVIDPEEEELMGKIDEIYTAWPFYGYRRIRAELERRGHDVGKDRVSSLMRKMGIQAIYPKKNTSKSCPENRKFPYLLRDLPICRSNQVWGSDITYIRLAQGFLYLVAIIDWFSRYVLAFRLSNTLEESFCIEALEDALQKQTPEIHNSDQGSQFTCNRYLSILERSGIQISMDGRGRALDNVFTERLWRSVKYEEVYLKRYESPLEAHHALTSYFNFYNYERPHQSLSYQTPAEVYFGTSKILPYSTQNFV